MCIGSLFFAALFCIIPLAAGQSTQPAEAWNTLTDQIVSTLPADNQFDALARLIPDETTIQQFDSNQTETRFRMADKLNHMSVLFQHNYSGAPSSLVTDLATTLADNPAVPTALRERLVPRDPAMIGKADTTAQRWITRMLSPDANNLVSVVLFWERPPTDATAPAAREPIFVLIKGRVAEGTPIITQIRYGQMSQALN